MRTKLRTNATRTWQKYHSTGRSPGKQQIRANDHTRAAQRLGGYELPTRQWKYLLMEESMAVLEAMNNN